MNIWLIETTDDILELHHNPAQSYFAFTLIIRNNIVSPRLQNIQEVKDTIKELGYTIVEFLPVQNGWPISI